MLESLPSAAFDDAIAPDAGVAAVTILPTDGERLMRFQRYRDEGAFAQVVESHAKMVWGVCSQILRHQQDVEDAFQATFLILARKAGSIRASDSAAGWIYRVAYRTALLAHSRRCRRKELQLADELPSLDDQLSEIERNEVALRLLEELNALPLRYRQPLVLCYMEGQSRSEAAEQMGVSTQTVKGLLARGTRLLRSRLIRRGIALSASMAVINSAMSSAHAAAAPSLVSSTASLGMSFALKLKVTASGIKGASLKSVAACALAEKGIIAMTIAAASKPAVGILGVCLAVGMLAVADAEPSKRLALAGGEGSVMLISTDAGDDSAADVAAAEEGEQEVNVAADVQADVDVAIEEEEVEVENVDVDVELSDVVPKPLDVQAPVPPTPPLPPADVVVPVPPVPGVPPAPGAMAIGIAGAPPVQIVEDVLTAAPAPMPVPVVQPLDAKFELARKFHYQIDQDNPFADPAQRIPTATTLAGGGSEAALKLEGEYWDLKAAGLKKKAEGIALSLKQATDANQATPGAVPQTKVIEQEAEAQLTLAEVKLCEMNAQRVRDSLEERAKAKEGEAEMKIGIKKAIEVDMKQAMEAAAVAQQDAAEAQQAAVEHAKQAARHAVEAAKGEAAKAAAKAWTIRAQAPTIKLERRAQLAEVPIKPNAPQLLKEVRAESQPFRESSDMAIVPKEELKRLLKLAESLEKQQESGELKSGSVGEDVKKLQRVLNIRIGAAQQPPLEVDGDFGPLTEQRVIWFQREHKINEDGVVGPETWKALEAPKR